MNMYLKIINDEEFINQRLNWLKTDQQRLIQAGFSNQFSHPQEKDHFPIIFDKTSGYSVPSGTAELKNIINYVKIKIPTEKRTSFIDLGYGFGDTCLAMNGLFEQIIGIDFKEKLLPVINKRKQLFLENEFINGLHKHSHFSFIQGDYYNLANYEQYLPISTAYTFPSLLSIDQIFKLARDVVIPLGIEFWFVDLFEIGLLEDIRYQKLEQGGRYDSEKVFEIIDLNDGLFLLHKINY